RDPRAFIRREKYVLTRVSKSECPHSRFIADAEQHIEFIRRRQISSPTVSRYEMSPPTIGLGITECSGKPTRRMLLVASAKREGRVERIRLGSGEVPIVITEARGNPTARGIGIQRSRSNVFTGQREPHINVGECHASSPSLCSFRDVCRDQLLTAFVLPRV